MSNMRKSIMAAAVALALPCLSGCTTFFGQSLPEGVPPPGAIVNEINDRQEPPKPDKAVNKISTSLTMKLVSTPSPRRPPFVSLREGTDDAGLGAELLKSLEKSKLVRIQPEASLKGPDFVISSELDQDAGSWTVKLLSPDGSSRLIWGETTDIDTSTLKAAQ